MNASSGRMDHSSGSELRRRRRHFRIPWIEVASGRSRVKVVGSMLGGLGITILDK